MSYNDYLKSEDWKTRRAFSSSITLLFLLTWTALAAASPLVCFSPRLDGGCDPTATIVEEIANAHRQVLVQAYALTSAPIAKALVDASRRNVEVQVILDRSELHTGYSAATFLTNSGVPVLIDSAHKIAHNKVVIIDGVTVITGSFNFTKAAEVSNAENLLVIHDPELANLYTRNWNQHAGHSQPFGVATGLPANATRREGPANGASAEHSGPMVGNRRSHIYAWPGCGSYDRMTPRNRVVFPSAQAAQAAGYRAAFNCQ